MSFAASVIVRAMDKASTIEATLAALRSQSVPVEIIVVDSGSTDGTVEIARRYADRLIQIPAEDFTYGGALNLGAEAASCEVHMALSAHCVPRFDNWVERSVSLYERHDVAGTNQASHDPRNVPIRGVYYQTLEDVRTLPYWGFSNHASSWRASVWREAPFREDLPACEDKEWSWRVLAAGWTIAFSPELDVPAFHRRDAGLLALWRRHRKEAAVLTGLGAFARASYREFPRRVRSLPRSEVSRYPYPVRLVNPYWLVAVHGDIAGARTRARLSGPSHAELTAEALP